jgi:hypothetical protein
MSRLDSLSLTCICRCSGFAHTGIGLHFQSQESLLPTNYPKCATRCTRRVCVKGHRAQGTTGGTRNPHRVTERITPNQHNRKMVDTHDISPACEEPRATLLLLQSPKCIQPAASSPLHRASPNAPRTRARRFRNEEGEWCGHILRAALRMWIPKRKWPLQIAF